MQPIQTALLSYGLSGEVFHAPFLEAHHGFGIRFVYQRDRAKKPRHAHPVTDSLDAILADRSVELVIVNTPNESHFRYAKAALEAGKHVVVEKPFTVTVKEADELIALARKQQRILTVYQNRRWDGGFLTVQKLLESKMLGRVVEFEVHYDRYRNYIEANTWKEVQQPGSGILYNLGSHMLDQVLLLFGKPQRVDARMGIQRTNGRVQDFYDIRVEYDGLLAIVKSSYLVREEGPMYRIHGTEGSYVKFGIDPQEQALKEKQLPGGPGWGVEPKAFWGRLNTTVSGLHYDGTIETLAGNYAGFYENLYGAIREGKELAVKPEESRNVIALIEAAEESSRKRAAVDVRL